MGKRASIRMGSVGKFWEVVSVVAEIPGKRRIRMEKSALYPYWARCALLQKARSANQEK
jgi:hypothetical protein